MPGMGGASGAGGGMATLNLESPYDSVVDIYGIIYIYNPVNPAKLGIDEAQDGKTAEGDETTAIPAQGAPDAEAASGQPESEETEPPAADTGAVPPAASNVPAADDTTQDASDTATAPDAPAADAVSPAAEPAADGTVPPDEAGSEPAAASADEGTGGVP